MIYFSFSVNLFMLYYKLKKKKKTHLLQRTDLLHERGHNGNDKGYGKENRGSTSTGITTTRSKYDGY